jgi:hypothetical protein
MPPPPKPVGPPDLNKLLIDLRARVMWGEDRGAIRMDAVKQGFPSLEVDRALDTALKERNIHFRKVGIDDIITAIGCTLGFLGALLLLLLTSKRFSNVQFLMVLFTLLGALPPAAIFFFTRGIRRILGGGRDEREATEVDEEV